MHVIFYKEHFSYPKLVKVFTNCSNNVIALLDSFLLAYLHVSLSTLSSLSTLQEDNVQLPYIQLVIKLSLPKSLSPIMPPFNVPSSFETFLSP